jgi:hypothetical protein
METTDEVGQAKPEPGNANSFNWWLFTSMMVLKNIGAGGFESP